MEDYVDKIRFRIYEKFIRHEFKRVNTHIPTKRISLNEAFQSHGQYIELPTQDSNNPYLIRRDDLKPLAIIEKELWPEIKVPLIIVRRIDIGRSVFKAENKVVEYVFSKLLGLYHGEYSGYSENRFFYWPHFAELKRILRSCLTIMFFSTQI
ncbi:hypothetical protein DRO02_01195 [archaeon]|nr:MAG: hypothetical protein DRO02_01195 [archaeon]RLG66012.1 MAG: hypothetical protein DRO21_00445 [archaeon]RLG66322.1 MAG: hypothetical protein DRN89_01150 [archaeon]HDM23990.1 DUF61 family protein [Candidatus Bathyarchaeota archaeon]